MQTQASQQHKQRVRIAGIAMGMSRAAAIAVLLAWTPSSIGSANHDSAPGKSLSLPVQAAGTKEAPADRGLGSGDLPSGPMCAELGGITATQDTERSAEAGDTVGCGIGNNLAVGMPASIYGEERVDVETFLEWHVQGRNVGQYAYQSTISDPSRTEEKGYRPSTLIVAVPFWNTNAR
jgi:hypothetical protein